MKLKTLKKHMAISWHGAYTRTDFLDHVGELGRGLAMRRFFLAFAVVAALLGASAGGGAWAKDTGEDLASVHAWVGKYSFNKINDRELWDVPAFRDKLKKALGRYHDVIQSEAWRVQGPQGPVERTGDVLAFTICEQHACSTDGATILVDVKKGVVAACLQKTNSETHLSEAFWLTSESSPRALPEDGCLVAEGTALYDRYGEP